MVARWEILLVASLLTVALALLLVAHVRIRALQLALDEHAAHCDARIGAVERLTNDNTRLSLRCCTR